MKLSKLKRAMDLKHQLEVVDDRVVRLRRLREARDGAVSADYGGTFGTHSVGIFINYVSFDFHLPIDEAFMLWLETQLASRRLSIMGELAVLGVEL